MSMIELKDIKKDYGKGESVVHALRGITLSVEEGEAIAIMGTSGCGKSTLLNILGFIDQYTEGEYSLDGKDVSKLTKSEMAKYRNRVFGFVVQDFALVSRLKVDENVMLPLEYVKLSKKEKNRMAEEILNKVGLSEKKNTYPSNLSGGQKQRVAIARALVNNAKILLCDEPTGALDSATTKEIMELFLSISKESKKTLIIVTHDAEVAKYCDRIIRIEDGVIA
ncbi:MAG: ABC transporter ATP-binding protein [Roseburia sp.]|nr:ABC transporter ATP-binding protein [Roseburia sp.]MCM1278002.1 ABC transporter ATP-binding protein [Robinsoniella sp.]